MALARAQMEQFREEGFVAGIPVFSGAECERFRETAERFRAEQPADRDWAFDIKCNLLFDWVYENATHPRLLDVVADLLGEDLLLTDSVFRIKEPGSGTHYGWHQDSARIVVEPAPAIVYVAISDATVENGCLAVIPRTHDRVRAFDLVANPGQAHRRVARLREVDPSRAVYMELRAGEVAIFSANVVHGSAAEPRAGRAVRDPPRLHAGVGTPVSRTGLGAARARPRRLRPLRARARSLGRLRGERPHAPADPHRVSGEHPDGPARARRPARLPGPPRGELLGGRQGRSGAFAGLERLLPRVVLRLGHDVDAHGLAPRLEETRAPSGRACRRRSGRRSTRVTGRTHGLVLVKNASSAV